MGGLSLDAVQDCIFSGNYHGGALALRGRFLPKIDYGHCRDLGTKPTYGRPFILWVPGYACPVPTDRGSYRTVARLVYSDMGGGSPPPNKHLGLFFAGSLLLSFLFPSTQMETPCMGKFLSSCVNLNSKR